MNADLTNEDRRLECIGGPWDGERIHPGPTGVIALVRSSEPLGFLDASALSDRERAGLPLDFNEPAIVGCYRIEERPDPASRHPGARVRFLRWEPRT
jgi:hypothetical protein